VRDKWPDLKAEPRTVQSFLQFIDQLRQFLRGFVRRDPGDPVMMPPAGVRQPEGECWDLDLPGQQDQLVNPRQLDIAEECQGKVDGFCTGAASAANLVQTPADLVQTGAGGRIGPQCEKQARSFWLGGFDIVAPGWGIKPYSNNNVITCLLPCSRFLSTM